MIRNLNLTYFWLLTKSLENNCHNINPDNRTFGNPEIVVGILDRYLFTRKDIKGDGKRRELHTYFGSTSFMDGPKSSIVGVAKLKIGG